MELLGYFGAAVIGISLGLLGGGGSILAVPLFVYFFALPPSQATSYSLFVVGLSSLIGFVKSFRQGNVDLKAGILFAIPSFVGVLGVRRWILPHIPVQLMWGDVAFDKEVVILTAFAVVMLLAALAMLIPAKKAEASSGAMTFAAKALGVGAVTGFVGAGGGFLIVPALVKMSGLGMRVAVGTSLGVIAANSLLGFFGDVASGAALDYLLLLKTSVLAVAGIFLGSYWGQHTPEAKLKPAFGVFVLVLGCAIIFQQAFN
ncbi:sulfite exporter TauE/SafE family protein [Bdellovibrio bacteriovorus]|uniref:sulfite exporter TauE/SafE family protein n=1 Tax=Bdellovibrio bacteriovorus TaxID=959 RepID=UPI0021CFAD5D|nr:sulfite exporter TauE/SafE family protein [Bdellovibrio bacteriovorus]UXR65010.1 sulfite exporter TauE/SafE family protein [Bdellovibrio bacteriovorus]